MVINIVLKNNTNGLFHSHFVGMDVDNQLTHTYTRCITLAAN